MTSTSLTVVVPTYNGQDYLNATLDSLRAQTTTPHVIVVDDGSDDSSPHIAAGHPAVDQVISQANRGVAAARNHGLAVARTKYVAFLDQDDMWHPERAEVLEQLARSSGAVAVGTTEQPFALTEDRAALKVLGDDRIDWDMLWVESGDVTGLLRRPIPAGTTEEVTVERLMQGAAAMTTSFMYEREAAIIAGGCAPFIRAADDHVLNVNIANIFGPIPRVDWPGLFYRVHPGATTQVSPLVVSLLTLQLALRYGRSLPNDADLGPNLEHLVWQIADQEALSRQEQLALVTLSTSRTDRSVWRRRWLRRVVGRTVRNARGWDGRRAQAH